ncbi:glycyl-radical enzyme activating protein [bacterium]|nr:glycyl-radical enzyme activating protein [bacterium]
MITGRIFDLERFSVHDGPGIRTTVFLQGCPLGCPWCHNPESRPELSIPSFAADRCLACELCAAVCEGPEPPTPDEPWPAICERCGRCVTVCPADARELVGRYVDAGDLLRELERDRLHYEESGGGVTFSGGEPLGQPEFLLEMLARCHASELHSVVDTTCHANEGIVAAAAELADLWLVDLKHPDAEAHARIVGVDNARILANLTLLARQGRRIWLRVPIVPGFTDDPAALTRTGRLACDLGIERVHLLPYHRTATGKYARFALGGHDLEIEPPTREHLDRLASGLRALGLDVHLGG